MYSGKSQSNRLSLNVQLVCHDTGDSSGYVEGSWMFRALAFFFKSLPIQTKPQNYFSAEQGSDSSWESPAIFEAAVIMCLSAEGSWLRWLWWLWHNVHHEAVGQQEAGSGGHRAEFESFLAACCPGTAF